MAKKPADPLQKLEEQLTCPVCLELYKNPKALPCQHNFCQDCVGPCPRELRDGKYFLKCPTCRKPAELPDGGVPALPPAFTINSFLELHKEMLAKRIQWIVHSTRNLWRHSVRIVRSWCAFSVLHDHMATIVSKWLPTSLTTASYSKKKVPNL